VPEKKGDDYRCTSALRPQHRRHGYAAAHLGDRRRRALGVGLSYAIANAIFGGSAEYVALWFKSIGYESIFFWYVTVMCGIALVAAITMPDTRRQGLLTEEESKLMEV